MANDLNQCNFIGRLGQDPETKYAASGTAITNISLAVGSKWKDKQTGQPQEHTEWIRGSAFGKLAEIIGEYCRKGQQLYVSGEWRTRKWTDQGGTDHYSTELRIQNMQMLGGKNDNPQGSGQTPRANPQSSAAQPAPDMDSFDDDIPF